MAVCTYVRYTGNVFDEIWHGSFDFSASAYGLLSIVRFHQKLGWTLYEWLPVSIFCIINILSMLVSFVEKPKSNKMLLSYRLIFKGV